MPDQKLSELGENTSPAAGDFLYLIDAPDKWKVQAGNVLDKIRTKYVEIEICDKDTLLTTGNGKKYIHIPPDLNGMDLVYIHGHVLTASAVGIPTFQVYNLTDAVDMLSTPLTIDATETDSSTAANAAVIDAAHDDVATNDVIQIDVDVAGDTTKGAVVTLGFRMP